jgi:hypothetical protein
MIGMSRRRRISQGHPGEVGKYIQRMREMIVWSWSILQLVKS